MSTATEQVSIAFLALAALLPAHASAQDEGAPVVIGQTYRVADHEYARIRAVEFQKYAAQGEWGLAVEKLQTLLDIPPALGVVVRAPGATRGRFVGVSRYARGLFDGLPDEGREAWEKVAREQAEILLERGLRMRRREDLADAARRFPARDVRRRAFDALARIATNVGDFSEAAHALEQLLETLEGDERAAVFARLALSRSQQGDRESVERVAALSQAESRIDVPGPQGPEPLSRFLERMEEASGPIAQSRTGWPQFTGNQHGTRTADRLAEPRERGWPSAVETLFQTGEENPRRYRNSRRDVARPVQPVVSGNAVYLNSGLIARAVDLDTGKTIWTLRGPCNRPVWRDHDAVVHTAAVTGDRVYVPLAARYVAPNVHRTFMRYTIIYAKPQRVLYALDRGNGEMIWNHAPGFISGREDEAEMIGESVASPPLLVGDDLLVATWSYESEYDVRLVCYDRHTGATRWRRSIAQGQQELNLFGRPVKELATSALAELDGVVYFATGLGVAAAVDRANGEVLWISAYPRLPIPRSRVWYETEDRKITWRPGPVVATRSAVVMAPPDSSSVLALDPHSGVVLWAQTGERHRNEYRWFAGVADDRVYVVGDRAQAFDLTTGEPQWKGDRAGRLSLPRQTDEPANGRPVLTSERLYVPTSDTILVLDTDTGAAEEAWSLPDGAGRSWGDLLAVDGTLLVTHRDDIQAFYRFEDLQNRLVARIAKAPDDPQLRLEAGEIFRTTGRLDDAISSLEHGRALVLDLAPRARDRLEGPMRRSLYEAYRARATTRLNGATVDGAIEDLQKAVEAAGEPTDAASGLLELADVAARFDKHRTAQKALERLLTEHGAGSVRIRAGVTAHAGAIALFRLGELDEATGEYGRAAERWLDLLERHPDADLGSTNVQSAVRERLEGIRKRHAAETADLIARRSREALNAARVSGDAAELSRVARLYPDPEVAAQAALLAADQHMKRRRPRAAMLTLRELLQKPYDDRTTARALWRLARAYREMRALDHERAVLERIIRDVPGIRLTTETVGDLAAKELADPRFRRATLDLPAPAPPLAQLWESSTEVAIPPTVLKVNGAVPAELEGHFLAARGRTLELLDGQTGAARWRKVLAAEVRHAVGTADIVALVGDQARGRAQSVTITAYDVTDGSTPWERTIAGAYRWATSSLGAVYVLSSVTDPEGRPRFSLTSIDLATGEVTATRPFEGHVGRHFQAAEDVLLVYEQSRGTSEASPRTVTILDAQSLTVRGRIPMSDAQDRWFAVHAPQTAVAVIVDGKNRALVGLDLVEGRQIWRRPFSGDATVQVKSLHALAGAVAVAGTDDTVRRIDVRTGLTVWEHHLEQTGQITYGGVVAGDGLIVANVKGREGRRPNVTSVCIDAQDGSELWRADLGAVQQSSATVCKGVVAYRMKVWTQAARSESFVLLLDRKDGTQLQRLQPERLERQYQTLFFAGTRIVMAAQAGIICFGSRDG